MAIDRYDPLKAPDAKEWLALDEDERMQLVIDYHVRARVELPNVQVHATMQRSSKARSRSATKRRCGARCSSSWRRG
jgi:hypothetical protein